ncbi:MAG: PEP-CTERM sorting domain-containing protein [Verrucomicrobiaceae bacterium]|nr:MAG: PEP-CTERM sorting domain-containing protein [Verrucomicrobiaceae bacterium]
MFKTSLSALALSLLAASTSCGAIVYVGGINVTIPVSSTQYLAIDLDGNRSTPRVAFVDVNTVEINDYDLFIGNIGGESVEFSSGATFGDGYVRRLNSGDAITPYSPTTYAGGNSYLEFEDAGEWHNFTGTAFAGLVFDPVSPNVSPEDGLLHAWVRIAYDDTNNTVTLVDFAYEDTPNAGIIAGAVPEPSAVGLAGLGALAMAFRRQRRA